MFNDITIRFDQLIWGKKFDSFGHISVINCNWSA